MEDFKIINVPWDDARDAANDQNQWKILATECALYKT